MMKRSSSAFGWVDLLQGILFLTLGIFTLRHPQAAVSSMVYIFAVAAIASGTAHLAFYAKVRRLPGFEPTVSLITGVISLLAGALLLANPLIGSWLLNFVLPMWLIAQCLSRILSYDLMKQITGKAASLILLCLNCLGLLLGVVMMFNTALFTFSMGMLTGFVLMVLGISNSIEAFSSLGVTKAK